MIIAAAAMYRPNAGLRGEMTHVLVLYLVETDLTFRHLHFLTNAKVALVT